MNLHVNSSISASAALRHCLFILGRMAAQCPVPHGLQSERLVALSGASVAWPP